MIANFKKKQKVGIFDNSFFALGLKVFFVVLILFILIADIKVYREKKKLDMQIERYKEEIQQALEKNNKLEEQIAKSDDKEYIEKIAREELDFQIQGEKVVTFITPEEKVKEEIQNNNFLNSWTGWLNGFWQWIKSAF